MRSYQSPIDSFPKHKSKCKWCRRPLHPQASLPTSTLFQLIYKRTKAPQISILAWMTMLAACLSGQMMKSVLILSRRLSIIGITRQKLFIKLPGKPSPLIGFNLELPLRYLCCNGFLVKFFFLPLVDLPQSNLHWLRSRHLTLRAAWIDLFVLLYCSISTRSILRESK